jgi:hypothetical protein
MCTFFYLRCNSETTMTRCSTRDVLTLYDINTPSVINYVAYHFWSKLNFVNFDQVLSKICKLLQYQINVI